MTAKDIVEITGAVTGSVAALVIIWRVLRWGRNITEAMRCLLRSDMLHTYYKHSDTSEIRQYEAEEFKKSYAGYKALGGNSFIDDVAEEVKSWKILT